MFSHLFSSLKKLQQLWPLLAPVSIPQEPPRAEYFEQKMTASGYEVIRVSL